MNKERMMIVYSIVAVLAAVLCYFAGVGIGKCEKRRADTLRTIEYFMGSIVGKYGKSLDPISEDDFKDLQALERIRKIIEEASYFPD